MSELSDLQKRFSLQVARLIIDADARGIPLRFGDAYRDPRATFPYSTPSRSVHDERLAIDLIADHPDHHLALHDLWDTMGGAPRIPGDLNHYSFAWGGVR